MRSVFHAASRPILLGAAFCAFGCSSGAAAEESSPAAPGDVETAPLPVTRAEFASIARGAVAFIDRTPHGLNGNGRACATCHMPTRAFQLSPADVETRFQALAARRRTDPRADDPLFRPIDADDFRINGESASDYGNLRQNGLIRITFTLPPTVRLIDPVTGDPSSEIFTDVWRAVPTVNNVKLTGPDPNPPSWPCPVGAPADPPCIPRGPNPNGGYQLDARIATLQEQALAAFTNHAQTTNAPSPRMLDDLANFQSALFSSEGLRLASHAVDEGVTPVPDPDPPLDALAQEGKVIFGRACATCHAGLSGTLPMTRIQRFGAINTACPRPVDGPNFPGYTGTPRFSFPPCKPELARNLRVYEVTLPDGTKTRRPSSDPGRTLLSGVFLGGTPTDDWQALDVPSTRGIGKTAPYFHNNSATTLDDVLDHYTEFFKFVTAATPTVSPTGTPLPRPVIISTDGVNIDRPFTPDERPALLAYLRKL
jgi:cytochrome c peroxidase